jgi:large subunit ribosomal protein L25
VSESFTLEVQTRTVVGKQVAALRKAKMVPAVVYGAGGELINIACPYRPLEIVLQKAGGTSIVNVVVDGKTHSTLVREVQRNKIRQDIMHVDFLRVDLTKMIRTEIAVIITNLPRLGNELRLLHTLTTIRVESLPTNIPHEINVDGARLNKLDAKFTVADLPALEGVRYMADPHELIARIEATVEVVEEAEEGGTLAEPEVIEKGKKEEEEF